MAKTQKSAAKKQRKAMKKYAMRSFVKVMKNSFPSDFKVQLDGTAQNP